MSNNINIQNKKARYEYTIIDTYIAGLQLTGTEVKSVRSGLVNLGDSYCSFRKGEGWVKKMHISEYEQGSYNNHEPMRTRKLLLTKKELKKIENKVKEKGYTVVPLRLFTSERGFVKLEIAVGQGKKIHDKRDSIKNADVKREIDRQMKDRD